MIIDLCFSSDDEKEKDTGPIDLCSPDASEDEAEPNSQDSAALAEPEALAEAAAGARAAEPAGVEAESVKREAPPGAAPPAKRARVDGAGGDDDVMEVPPPPPVRPLQAPPAGAAGDDDDEIQITQHSGALTDFPHSREHCTTFPIAADASKRCANCYCYVCDAPAAKCTQWATHCAARHGDPRWRAERAAHARGDTQQGAQQLAARGTTTAAVTVTPVARGNNVEAILEAVTRVYPEEAQAPAGFTTGLTLRPYQRQSLAFMLNVERRTGGELPTLGLQGTRGGWLCDEVGMGKTAVVIATCLANRATHKRGSDTQWAQMLRLLTRTPDSSRPAPNWSGARLPLKATLVLTNVSLVGQWEDEFKTLNGFFTSVRH